MSKKKLIMLRIIGLTLCAPFILSILPVFLLVRGLQAGWYFWNELVGDHINIY